MREKRDVVIIMLDVSQIFVSQTNFQNTQNYPSRFVTGVYQHVSV